MCSLFEIQKAKFISQKKAMTDEPKKQASLYYLCHACNAPVEVKGFKQESLVIRVDDIAVA